MSSPRKNGNQCWWRGGTARLIKQKPSEWTMSAMGESGEGDVGVKTLDAAEEILHARRIDRILGYVRMKMDVALAANNELSSTRTQIVQMGAFLLVAFVIGTGGVESLLEWKEYSLGVAAVSALIVSLVVLRVTRTSAIYTDIVMDEFHALETIYSLIVWETADDLEALTAEIAAVERGTRSRIDAENKRHRLLTGTILHTMIHYERHSPFQDDIGQSEHVLPVSNLDGHRHG